MWIRATHSDGRSVRRGQLTVEADGLTFDPRQREAMDQLHIRTEEVRRASVEEHASRWQTVPRRRIRVQLTGGVDHWFIVDRPEATVALIEALASEPSPHPAIVERRRRDARGGSPIGALWSQMFFVALLLVGVVSRTIWPRPDTVFSMLDVVILCILTLMTAWTLHEMWRYRRYRLSP